MSELKFACPVCGQHITADSRAAGSQLDCPTCFRKIVVPRAPGAADTKFILAASEVNKPRASLPSSPAPTASGPTFAGRARTILVIGLILAAATTAFLFRQKIFDRFQGVAQPDSNEFSTGINTPPWTLNLADAQFPEGPVTGRLRGRDFVAERAVLQGGTLSFRMNHEPLDMAISIHLFARQAADLSGKSAIVTVNNSRSPRVILHWKAEGQNTSETFTNGYAFNLKFGTANDDHMPGKIYLCLPDETHSCIAGEFNAEIRKPAAPKPETVKND